MSERFNILVDPWLPLEHQGSRTLATLPALLCGAHEDARTIAHPRAEFRAFAQMLASALAQALLAPTTLSALEQRIERPLEQETVRRAFEPVMADFELLGEPGWMQWGERTDEDHTEKLVHELSETYQPALARGPRLKGGLCLSCATLGLYGFQAFAPAGGRGISPGVRGSPPLTTLVEAGSVRRTLWANVLVQKLCDEVWGEEPARPWATPPESRGAAGPEQTRKPAHAIGLVEGLFWKPRCVRLAPAEDGLCALCGAVGERVRVCAFRAGARKEDGYYAHPLTPSRFDKDGERRTRHVPTESPVWTGLADMIAAARTVEGKAADAGGSAARAAPVVEQWLRMNMPELRLLVFAYRFDNAAMEGKFFEPFPALHRAREGHVEAMLRALIERAEETLSKLLYALRMAASEQHGGKASYWPDDARLEFWRRTEGAFWEAVRAIDAQREPEDFGGYLERTAKQLFVANTEPAALEPRHQRLVVRAQAWLARELRKLGGPSGAAPTQEGATP